MTFLTFGVKGQIPIDGLILYQTFNHNYWDVSGYQQPSGSNITYSTDRVSRTSSSCHFSGNTTLTMEILNDSNPDRTVRGSVHSFWFKTSSVNESYLMERDYSNTQTLTISINDGILKLNDKTQTSVKKYNDNKFHHVLLTKWSGKQFNPNTGLQSHFVYFQLFVDTILEVYEMNNLPLNETSEIEKISSIGGKYYFGTNPFLSFMFIGEIDDISIYNIPSILGGKYPFTKNLFTYKPPVFEGFTHNPDSTPNFTIKGKYFQTDGGVSSVIFSGGSQNPITIVNDSSVQTNVPNNIQDGLVVLVKGFDTTYSPVSFKIDTSTTDTTTTGITSTRSININIFPNPTKDLLFINTGNYQSMIGYSVKIINSLGQVVYTGLIDKSELSIDMTKWNEKGLCFLQLIDNTGNIIDIRKILLQ